MESPVVRSEQQRDRTAVVTGLLAEILAEKARARRPRDGDAPVSVSVVVDGRAPHAADFADLLADRCSGRGAEIVVAAGPESRETPPSGGWDAVVYLRTAPAAGNDDRRDRDRDRDRERGGERGGERDRDRGGERAGDAEDGATVVIDFHDPAWPVIRRLHPDLADRERWYLPESQAFFAVRAATWDIRFGDDMPAYAAAVAEADLGPGCRVADIGCGTGRALPALREAVGEDGAVLGLDVTVQMLGAARDAGRDKDATLIVADARRLPLADAGLDAIFAAGLVNHLPDAREGLRELARATRPSGQLVIFHPSGRAALAARHGRTLRPDEPLDRSQLEPLLAASGWRLHRYDDAPHRFLAVARRTAEPALIRRRGR